MAVIGEAFTTAIVCPVSPSNSVTVPWCGSRPRAELSGTTTTVFSPYIRASPPRCAGMSPIRRLVARRPDDRPQREMDLAARDGDERALDRGEAAGRVEELLDVRFAQDEHLAAKRVILESPGQPQRRPAWPSTFPHCPTSIDALEPHIDAKTMEIHHGKHHQAYVDNANKALEGTQWADASVEDVLRSLDDLPEDKQHGRPQQRRRPRESLAVLADHEP